MGNGRGWKTALLLCTGCVAALTASQAPAETLLEALTKAYVANPTLSGARASQRSVDEDVAIAKANARPSASLVGTYSEAVERQGQILQSEIVQTTPARTAQGQAQINVPLYNGGAIRNAIDAAELRVEAGQNNLRATEASLFSRVVAAYMDVIRDSQIVILNQQNVSALEVNYRASSDRFQVGDLTRTDVAQSDSRLATARADLARAEAQLITSKENYVALVGSPPDSPQFPAPLPGLPTSPELAVSVALTDNADIRAAEKNRDAARRDVRSARAQVSPRLAAFANGTYADYLNSENKFFLPGTAKNASVGATLTLPLYQGGRPAAQERQAVARESASIERTTEVERNIISQVRSAYASWQASLRAIESNQIAVKATELSLEGVRAENSVGTRTILDILNAEQEALNARVQLVTNQRNAFVAAFTLIATMGHAEARDLGIDTSILYDATQNYDRVKGKVFDFDFDSRPTPVSGSTANTPAQNALPEPIATPQ